VCVCLCVCACKKDGRMNLDNVSLVVSSRILKHVAVERIVFLNNHRFNCFDTGIISLILAHPTHKM